MLENQLKKRDREAFVEWSWRSCNKLPPTPDLVFDAATPPRSTDIDRTPNIELADIPHNGFVSAIRLTLGILAPRMQLAKF